MERGRCGGARHSARPMGEAPHEPRPSQHVAVVAFANKLARIAWAVLAARSSVLPPEECPMAA